MILKNADNKEFQLQILKNLLSHPRVPSEKKQQIEKELRSLSTGIATEKDAAYEIDFRFGASQKIVVIHDLRLEVNGRVAQIDHLLMNRFFEAFVLETKTLSTGLSINEEGEFSTFYDGREIGIPSPVEQNNRHIAVLRDALKVVGLPKRLGISYEPAFRSVVLVSPKAVIRRPTSSKIDTSTVLKLDTFFSYYMSTMDEVKLGDFAQALKISSVQTIKDLGEKLVQLHKPARIDYVKKFGLADALLQKPHEKEEVVAPPKPPVTGEGKSKYFCAACRTSIAEVVARYCWNNKSRFSGKCYCRPCQAKF